MTILVVGKNCRHQGSVDLKSSLYGAPLKPDIKSGNYYYDCWVDDARLVITNALDAQERGASILDCTECVKAVPQNDGNGWTVSLKDHRSGEASQMTAGLLVNAADHGCRSVLKL